MHRLTYYLEVIGVYYKWYQSKSWNTWAYLGSKWSYIFCFGTNDWVFPCDNRNQQAHTVRQCRYLKMYETQIFIDLVVVQEKEEHLLKITIKMAITFSTSTLGRWHKCIGVLLFPWFSFEKFYEWLIWLFRLYLNCTSKFLVKYKSLLRQSPCRWKYYSSFYYNSNVGIELLLMTWCMILRIVMGYIVKHSLDSVIKK